MALPFATDDGWRPRIGVVVLRTDETLEPELREMFAGSGAGLYHSRVESAPEVSTHTLGAMQARLAGAAAMLPGPLDVVGYGCTSGTAVIGARQVAAEIGRIWPPARVTEPLSAALAAFAALGVARIALLTPYVPEVTETLAARFAEAGVEVARVASFSQSEERVVARIAPSSVRDAVARIAGGVEAVFVSCTNLRSLPVIAAAERDAGVPVVSSNLALGWHMARLAGLGEMTGPGRLFAL